MVGVPRSNGCSLCVKRRVKVGGLFTWSPVKKSHAILITPQCDQRLPGCAKCDKYGQPCPGYDRGFKFITGKPYRDRRQPNPKNDKNDGARSKSAASNPMIDLEPTCQTIARRDQPSSLISVDMNIMQHLCVLIDDFSQPYTPSPTHVVVRWFGFLPSIYGQNRVLDATIRSFTAHHFGRTTKNTQMVSYARSAYGEALRGLRKSLETPAESLSSHIFCAVVLLCMYEVKTFSHISDSYVSDWSYAAFYRHREPRVVDEARQRAQPVGTDSRAGKVQYRAWYNVTQSCPGTNCKFDSWNLAINISETHYKISCNLEWTLIFE